MSKDQKHDTHLCSDRSESSFKSLVLLTHLLPSGENIFVLTTLITLIIVHITSIFIFPYVSYFKLNIYAVLLYKNISESILYVLRISYWWDIRAIYRQYLHLKFWNFVYRWLWCPTSNRFLKHTRFILKYSYIAAQHIYSV